MSFVLAIETSGRIGSVALVQGRHVLAEDRFEHGLKHAAEMVPRIDALCRNHGASPGDLAEIYISVGPGSFTGLRIGVTFAKTLAFATGAKLVAVPSTRVLAANAPADAQHVVLVLDAKRGQIFTARYTRAADGWMEIEPPRLDDLASVLIRSPRPVVLLGEGIPYHRQAIPANDPDIFIAPESSWRARASVVAEIGAEMSTAGEFTEPDRLIPLYIRLPEAEEKYAAMVST